MTWRPTPALVRTVLVAVGALAAALLTGSPALVVLGAPFAVAAVLGVLARPAGSPRVRSTLDHVLLHEGQGSTVRLVVEDADGAEHVTRVAAPAPYVALEPRSGAVGGLRGEGEGGLVELAVGPRRWGRREIGAERVGLTSAWAAWRAGPVDLPSRGMFVLPQAAPYGTREEMPQPEGLVGAHRSRKVGSGTEMEGIRPFTTGDRLRRISWPVSLRTGELHVVTSRAEQDAGVWIVVDALREVGVSEGVDGRASSLDLGVRAAAALATHHTRRGDRVGLQVLGTRPVRVGLGAGPRHLRRLTGTLARIQADHRTSLPAEVDVTATTGSVVYLLSPMLHTPVLTAAATLMRRGLTVVAIDTVGEQQTSAFGDRSAVSSLAWRMRQVERRDRLDRLASLGCPVIGWRGPGTLDVVLRRLARRAQVPRLGAR